MPSISSRRFTFCTMVPVCRHLCGHPACCQTPKSVTQYPYNIQVGFISALCKKLIKRKLYQTVFHGKRNSL